MHGQKSDRSIELRREGEEDSAAVMICDVFTAATCSRLVNQTPTHTDEPHLRGAGALLQIHPAAQQEAAVAIVTARSTGGVCGSESVHWHSFLLKRWCYTAVCLLFAIQEVFTPALKDGLTHNFVTLEVRVCGERLGNSRILKKGSKPSITTVCLGTKR